MRSAYGIELIDLPKEVIEELNEFLAPSSGTRATRSIIC